MNDDFSNYVANPRAFAVKRWLSEFLKDRYHKHEDLAERISISLVTQEDLTNFGKLLTDLFELGYLKAVNDYKDQLKKHGITVKIVPDQLKSG